MKSKAVRCCLGLLWAMIWASAAWASGERPVLVLGYPEREKNPFIADAPSNDGIFQDVLKLAAERVGAELRIERLPKKRVFQYMREGKVDLYPGTPTPERNETMVWISLGFRSKNVCLVRAETPPFKHLREAPPLRLIYEVGDSRANLPKQYPQLKGIAAAAQLSTDDAVRMLRGDYGDLFVTQRETYLFYLRSQQLDSLERFKIRYEEDCTGPGRDYVLGVAKRSRHYAGRPNPDYRPALRQRHQTVPTGVLQRGDAAVRLSIHHDMLAADRTRKQRVLDVGVPGRRIPGVERKGGHRGLPVHY